MIFEMRLESTGGIQTDGVRRVLQVRRAAGPQVDTAETRRSVCVSAGARAGGPGDPRQRGARVRRSGGPWAKEPELGGLGDPRKGCWGQHRNPQ